MRRATLVAAAKLAFGVALLALLVSGIEPQALGAAFSEVEPRICALAFGVWSLFALAELLRLYAVFGCYPLSLAKSAHLYFTGMFFANFIPSSLGGEVYRLHLLRQLDGNLSRPLALLLFVRLSGLALLLGIAALCIPWAQPGLLAGGRIEPTSIWLAVLAGTSLAGAVVLLPAGRRVLARARPWLDEARSAITNLSRGRVAWVIGLGAAVWLLRAGTLYWFARAVDESPRFADVLLIAAFTNLVSLLPISFSSLGVREGAIVVGLGAVGLSGPHALAVALLSRSALWATSLVGGVLYLAGSGRRSEALSG